MRRGVVIILGVGVLIAGFLLAVLFRAPAPRETKLPPPVPPLAATPAPAENVALRTSSDGVEIFKRAFWREPAPEDRILNAERREWVSPVDGVRRWQWFIQVEPGDAFTSWFREKNPFALSRLKDAISVPVLQNAPSWFPGKDQVRGCEIHMAGDQRMLVIFDPARKSLFATDAGGGFAVGSK